MQRVLGYDSSKENAFQVLHATSLAAALSLEKEKERSGAEDSRINGRKNVKKNNTSMNPSKNINAKE